MGASPSREIRRRENRKVCNGGWVRGQTMSTPIQKVTRAKTTCAFYKAVEHTRYNWTLLQKLGTLFLTLGEFSPYNVHVATQMPY